jgi:hypothetical protein
MHSLSRFSWTGTACLLLALTLPMGCAPGTPTVASSSSPLTTSSVSSTTAPTGNTAAVTGIVYVGSGTDGRLVPPEKPVTIDVVDGNTTVATIQTDSLGRFYLSNIPAPAQGKVYDIKVGTFFEQRQALFPGRVVSLSSIKIPALTSANQRQVQRVTGILLNTEGQPLGNVEVRDKSSTFRKTVTDGAGRFTLEIIGDELEVVNGLVPITIAAEDLKTSATVRINTTNIRTVRGRLSDQTNSNTLLPNIRVRVQGGNISARTDADGNFVLNGAPVDPFILEVESPKGYAPSTIEIPPATFDQNQRPQGFEQNLALQPVGSILINFTAETAPGFDRIPPVDTGELINGQRVLECGSYLNCFLFDLTGVSVGGTPNPPRPEYDNGLAVINQLTAFVSVEGTGVTQTVTYPPAPFRILYGIDKTGGTVRVADRARAGNVIVSLKLDDIPGGRQSVTVSMNGFQTQKSLPIYVPPNDTISTELITLYGVEAVSSFGDVKGTLRGTQVVPAGQEIRIVYLDVKENLGYVPADGDKVNPELLTAIQTALSSGRSIAATEKRDAAGKFLSHEFYLKNVPTGTRVMLAAAMVNTDGTLSGCYIPNTSVLLNVRASQINLAPDLLLTLRPTEGGCVGTN